MGVACSWSSAPDCTVYLHKMPGRNRIPIEHRERIFRAFEDEAEDYLLVADTLVVNRSMAGEIVTQTLDGFLFPLCRFSCIVFRLCNR